ncbi:toxin secretion/phage lysis holin family protein [[Clostridium] sordellii ATCC 9714]|uniref:Holin-like pore-forming protein n=1 Tax=Paraclostridium sordellii TaxID=1505 RepID=Q46343_PARSO|nr:phage holin family protein [Paeniclostridium sordellii]EPZ61152.1 toxin secretion/phage lysis holin family protein [[Clostridium] sordellii ATCC 9714] [Paeniclostridium sordellii ATCC 9714]AHB59892.1 holin-like protein [Paeniclostridium sordellii]TAN66408.1 holin [Paeniclostridium sordellii 8483]CAA57960.1 ORF [[Clostridium] sordellii] [Paeniclostridium sordellii]CEJ75464.1 Holin-like pore-forming protein (plasmid) [[Clostridium] sordellii] [Paeniclostridium sordellii]
MNITISFLSKNIFIKLVMLAITFDTLLGCLRAIKTHKFNSSFGINGGIRKIAMIACIFFLSIVDMLTQFNFLFILPQEYINFFRFQHLGISEFFSMLFIFYESISILKNMYLCGLPVPKNIQNKMYNLLYTITDEVKIEDR